MKFTLSIIASIIFLHANAQVALSGRVNNAGGAVIPGAYITITELSTVTIRCDSNGFFSYKTQSGSVLLEVKAGGYIAAKYTLSLDKDTFINIVLKDENYQTDPVTISRKVNNANVKDPQMGKVMLTGRDMKKIPVIFGEPDVLKAITLMPGIKSGGEGSTGIYVRGGGPDQNLILLDGINIYNAGHLLGMFSVFNGDIVENVTVYKGTMPAQYGGRLSSVIEVETRNGDKKEFKYSGGVGLIASKVKVEGPLKKDKSSFILSVRRTYADAVARPFLADTLKKNTLYFYDVNLKMFFDLGKSDKLYLTAYSGKDAFRFTSSVGNKFTFNVNYGNNIAGIRWNHLISPKAYSNTFLYYNDFALRSKAEFLGFTFSVFSGLKDINIKHEYTWNPAARLKTRSGIAYTYHTFIPGVLNANAENVEFSAEINRQYAHEAAAFAQAEYSITSRLSVNAGYRHSYFNQVGPYEQFLFDQTGAYTGQSINYAASQSVKQYQGPEPRIAFKQDLNDTSSIKLSYNRAFQYLHLATSSSATLPTDLWVPCSRLIKPQIADQIAAGWYMNAKDNMYEFSVETYYKTMRNQIEFKPGANLFFNQNLEGEMVFGKGKSYGIELLAKKNSGRFTGWIGYTLSWTTRQFEIFNDNKPYYYRYDRRHDISVTSSYTYSKKWSFNFVFVYGTGQKLTLPTQRFAYLPGASTANRPGANIIDRYTSVSNYTMPAYHRADISANYVPRPDSKKRFKSSWNFSIYNLYSRANPFFIYVDADLGSKTVTSRMVYLFPIVPSATWYFNF